MRFKPKCWLSKFQSRRYLKRSRTSFVEDLELRIGTFLRNSNPASIERFSRQKR